jgi:hypothetical protein
MLCYEVAEACGRSKGPIEFTRADAPVTVLLLDKDAGDVGFSLRNTSEARDAELVSIESIDAGGPAMLCYAMPHRMLCYAMLR